MSYRRQVSSGTARNAKYGMFAGIGGPALKVFALYDPEQRVNISDSFQNEITDLNLSQKGSAFLRDGSVKTLLTGYSASVGNIFYMTVGNVITYGVVVNGALSVIELPKDNVKFNPVGLPVYARASVTDLRVNADPSVTYP